MKKNAFFFLLVLLTFSSCEEDVIEVSFRIEPVGFSLDESYVDTSSPPSSFSHRFAGGYFTFTNDNHFYEFDTRRIHIDAYDFRLPVGEYLLECKVDPASIYGQSGGSFIAPPQYVVITDSTETIHPKVEANCSLFLVDDSDNQLNEAPYMIEKFAYGEGFFVSYPMTVDTVSGLYYAYFSPDPQPENPSAFVWFYKGKPDIETGGLSTVKLSTGKIYRIKIIE